MTKHLGLAQAAAVALLAAAAHQPAAAAGPKCEVDRPIVFAGLDWDSAGFHNAVARFILEKGYGCKTDSLSGSTLPLLAGMGRGDIDVTMEIWEDNIRKAWDDLVKKGKVASLGVNFPDAEQGWYVPRYLVEGAAAKAPALKSVSDLPKYKELFADPEEPSKGRFYNCILGWSCEVVNSKKLHAYGLDADFTNFRPGTGAALAAAIASNYKRAKPFVAYYWTPTWIMGQYDMVKLQEPAYDKAIWDALFTASKPQDVKQATAYPTVEVTIGINTAFMKKAPRTVAFLKKYKTTSVMVSKALSFMQEKQGTTAEEAAVRFLSDNTALWTQWVPAAVAQRVKAAL